MEERSPANCQPLDEKGHGRKGEQASQSILATGIVLGTDAIGCLLSIQFPLLLADKILALFPVAMRPTKHSRHRILLLGMIKSYTARAEDA